MGATTSLANRQLSVTPGQAVEATVLVRNNGTLVDQFTLDIVGDSREWSEVTPRVMNLMPGQDGEATVRFEPPRNSSVPAGQVPFGVRVISREDPPNSSVAEGAVDVEPFMDLQLELSPKSSRCRTKAVHEVVVENSGNYPIPVEVITNDPEEQLKLSLDHSALTVQPGTSAFLKLKAKPYDRFLRGADKRLPFGVTAIAPDQPPVNMDGTVVQQQMLPKWLLPAAVAVLAAAVVLAVLWFTLVKPTVQTAAREAGKAAAEEAQAELQEQANLAERRAVAAEEKANAAEKKVDEMAANGGPGDGAAGGGARGATTDDQGVDISDGTAVDFRITTDADAQADPAEFESFAVPNGAIPPDKTLVLTDIILQNPRGDSGTLAIKRGDDVLYATGLQNFRDMDFHFLEPWTFSPDQPLTVEVSCQLPGAPEPATGKCTPAVSFSGRLSGPTPN
ncbi:COG1470 family protein [Actinophytocola algeriensis]|uniref:Hydrolytic protein n=1 Tax=Actinophytocola algeriensis TaxID=1768010 RepID=A0A7W7QAR1_9PSEU|nr:hypothetical protein [Actinophytocola algeriensis]MBB4910205.1 hypothetical protein [Actinophytocola algeriensis]MBE1480806.1 hypothetical protein [Actinophytocola algeriensis]